MKYFNHFFSLVLLMLLYVGTAVGVETNTEGTSFWFAIPKNDRAAIEKIRGSVTNSSFELWITSQTTTTAKLYDANGALIKSIDIIAGESIIEPIQASFECTENETITEKGLYLEAEAPVSVMVYVAYKWTGEAYKILPVSWLGYTYFTLNLYQDHCKMYGETNIRMHPAQILVVATEDNTEVKYWPTWETEGGVKAGEMNSVTLNKGNTYLILGKTNTNIAQVDETDLTGTKIIANRPIAVYSGHTKGAYPRINPTYYSGLKADFTKNALIETMIPINMLGKDYVFVPNKYADREKGYQGYLPNERGDMLKFVATKDNTIIYKTTADGTRATIGTIQRAGDWIQESDCETPTLYSANEPIMVGQYGKSWLWWPNGVHYKEGEIEEGKEDELMNPSGSGQGQLYTMISNEHWADYASFVAPPEVNNFFNLIFKTGDEDYISFNEVNIRTAYASLITEIPGTEYSYISSIAPTGENNVKTSTEGVYFGLYAYGNMDGYKDGFAYGYPVAINKINISENLPCDDSVYTIIAEPSLLDYEMIDPGSTKMKEVNVINYGNNDLYIRRLYLRNGNVGFRILNNTIEDFTIPAGQQITLQIEASLAEGGLNDIRDTLMAEMVCETANIAEMKISSGKSDISMNNLSWVNVQIDEEYQRTKPVVVRNIGNAPAIISGYTLSKPDEDYFTFTGLENLSEDNPITLEAGESIELLVTYDHKNEAIQHSQRLTLKSPNTTESKLYSDWVNSCYVNGVNTEGTSFWFALPKNNRATTESFRGSVTNSCFEMWVTSKESTTVRLYDSHQNLIKSFEIPADGYAVEPLNSEKECTESEIIYTDKAYYVESDAPVSVMVYMSYKWTGEAFRIIPDVWLGTKYYSMNLYQDHCKMYGESNIRMLPAQILIIATEDNTEVTYKPTWDTESGVKAGEEQTITLNKGNSYLILGKINTYMAQVDETDLTGTEINANKPIAVYSGHTKGAYPRINPTYYGGLKADFLKNMLFDSMWPVEYLGKEYISIPNKYVGREKGYQGYLPEERGDMLKFVATKDSTSIFETLPDSSIVKLATIKKAGQWYAIPERETPGYYTTSEPVLVGQYGKGWFWWPNGVHYKEGEIEEGKEDELMNPSGAGQGQLYILTPNERWTSYAGFVCPPEVNNFFNLVFKTGDEEYINFNGANIGTNYEEIIQPVPGTEYSYLSCAAPTGGNFVESTDDSVTFALYAYGSMDGYKDGFAYGYPSLCRFFTPCNDTIVVDTTMQDDNSISGKISAVSLSDESMACAKIQAVKYEVKSQMNAIYTPNIVNGEATGTFTIDFFDKTKPGYLKLICMSKSGATVTKEFSYTPEGSGAKDQKDNEILSNVIPNPVCTSGVIKYYVPNDGNVTIAIYNATGTKITTLVNELKAAGNYEVTVDAGKLGMASGSYTYRIDTGSYSETKTMVITK